MKQLPLLHNFNNKRCLMVGGGKTVARRAKALISAGGSVDVIAVKIRQGLAEWVIEQGGTVSLRAYQVGDITADYDLVVAATDKQQVNEKVAKEARKHRCLVNVVDNAGLCDVAFPSVIDRHPLMITVSSGSASPVLSRLLSRRINALIPSGYGRLADLVGKFRKQVRRKIPDTTKRIEFWENILQGVVAEKVFSGNMAGAEQLLNNFLNTPHRMGDTGEVYLIGAGPGDPDLLTLRAFRLLQQAEVVLYDRLVSPQILNRLDENTELIYVGKRRADHSLPQADINQLLIDLANKGKRVARLKGGDPFIFGRGGEEIEQLAEHQIPFQVIPGITAANGCSCYAGIPLTHRDHAQSVRFVTGQLQDGTVNLNWAQLVGVQQTLVFYMGLNGLVIICENLIRHGQAGTTPFALIEKGTTLDQRIHLGTLETIGTLLDQTKINSPSLFIVGSVVSLHDKLSWFGSTI